MNVVVMGNGRLASAVVGPLRVAGLEVNTWRRGQVVPEADAYWALVSDRAVLEVAALCPPHAVVLHACGAQPVDWISREHTGVVHPLMSFAAGSVLGSGVVARVGGVGRGEAAAQKLAGAIGLRAVSPHDFATYHLAACLASGHLAALFLEACTVLQRAGVSDPAAALLPLAAASLQNAAKTGSITGPAARGDVETVALHRTRLHHEAAVYNALDQRILGRGRG